MFSLRHVLHSLDLLSQLALHVLKLLQLKLRKLLKVVLAVVFVSVNLVQAPLWVPNLRMVQRILLKVANLQNVELALQQVVSLSQV
jgi:hypothetical protein